ncbi:MAG: DUF2203 domain-containing protein [Candidatus Korobacteraceae bacterium]
MGKKRTFTVSEAEAMLPILGGLLRRAIAAKHKAKEIEEEFEHVRTHVFASGGADLDIVALSRRRAEGDKSMQQIKDSVAEIQATGVLVKDIDMGLLDFPCNVEGHTILLCWKFGEEKITHWHGTDEGFASRKRIDGRIPRGRRKVQ